MTTAQADGSESLADVLYSVIQADYYRSDDGVVAPGAEDEGKFECYNKYMKSNAAATAWNSDVSAPPFSLSSEDDGLEARMAEMTTGSSSTSSSSLQFLTRAGSKFEEFSSGMNGMRDQSCERSELLLLLCCSSLS